jgi:RNA polymerase sigma-70 factor (ECF subfamily)
MRPESPTDGEIIEQIRSGDISSFAHLVERYQGPLVALAVNRLGRRDLAEDAVQEAFLCAYRWLDSYDSKFAFRTWLWTILLNQCKRAADKERRVESLRIGLAFEAPNSCSQATESPSTQLELSERQRELSQALKKLPESHADALRLRFFGGLKFDAIADATGCSLRTAKHRVKEGLLRLGELLREENGQSTPIGESLSEAANALR